MARETALRTIRLPGLSGKLRERAWLGDPRWCARSLGPGLAWLGFVWGFVWDVCFPRGVSHFLICSFIFRLCEMTNILQILQYHSSRTVSSVCKSDLQDLLNVLFLKGNSTKF